MEKDDLEAVRQAKKKFAARVPAGVDVVGVGIGRGASGLALKVNLRSAPANRKALPKTIDGVPIIYDVVGKIVSF